MGSVGQPLTSLERLRAVAEYDLFSPQLRAELDDLAWHTALALSVPASLVTFVLDSAQYIAGGHGVQGWVAATAGTPAEWAFCAHVVTSGGPYVVEDAAAHPVHGRSPLVLLDGVRSYAGVPLRTPEGHLVGAHCVIDVVPRRFGPEEIAVLAGQVELVQQITARYRRSVPGERIQPM